ncbi:MAG: cytidine deaminase [Gemmatimonadetes bacterium]|nr:MAG: cytidine deaminase [Gemmatimonadota bacterium]
MATSDHLSWDEYFMGIAIFTSLRSKDPKTKVGAIIVNDQNHIVGTGYNGFVAGADESKFTWNKTGAWLETKYPYVVHAEANALLNTTVNDLQNCRVYVTLFPCNECAKQIAQKKLAEVIYLRRKDKIEEIYTASERIFEATGIKTRQLVLPSLETILHKFTDFIP